jgi:4a-hydroxytetrahydrobiopterin dehydratase
VKQPDVRRNSHGEPLVEKTCTPYRGGIPPLSADEAATYLRQIPAWTLLDEATRLERTFRFRNFAARRAS